MVLEGAASSINQRNRKSERLIRADEYVYDFYTDPSIILVNRIGKVFAFGFLLSRQHRRRERVMPTRSNAERGVY